MNYKLNKVYVVVLFVCFYCAQSYGQITTDLIKYWYYRDRLKYFVVPGEKYGESQIICIRNLINASNDPNNEINPKQWTNADYGQIGKHTALYLGTLATEYYLLKRNGQYDNAAKTAYELYLALFAIQEYWDKRAEDHWPDWQPNNSNFTDPLNGFFIRGNVPCDFYAKNNDNGYDHGYTVFGERHVDLLNKGLDSLSVFDPTAYRFKNSNNGYLPLGHPGYIDHRTSDLCYGLAYEHDVPNFGDDPHPERMSQDEAIGLMLGMALTIKLTDDNIPYNQNGTIINTYCRQRAIFLFDKIVRYCVNLDKINGDNSFRIFDPNHSYDFTGSSTYTLGKGFIMAGHSVTGYDYGHVNESWQNFMWMLLQTFGYTGGPKNSSMIGILGAIGNSWTNTYEGIENVSFYNNTETFYLLLWEVLNNLRPNDNKQTALLHKSLDQLDQAPCEGPFCYRSDYIKVGNDWVHVGSGIYSDGIGWASSYKWFKEQIFQNGGDPSTGNFHGLDYMLLYNLYHIVHYDYCPHYVNYIDRNLIGSIPSSISSEETGNGAPIYYEYNGTYDSPILFVAFSKIRSIQKILANDNAIDYITHPGTDYEEIHYTSIAGHVTYVAGESIHLNSGFHVKEGSYFHAYISDIDCDLTVGKDSVSAYPNNMYTPYFDSLISQPKTPYDLTLVNTESNTLTLECPLDTIRFKGINGDTVDDLHTYFWDFGNGITSTEVDPQVYYEPGTYNFSLALTDTNGVSDTMKLIVVVPDCGTQTGMEDQSSLSSTSTSNGGFTVVPNPNNGQMTLVSKNIINYGSSFLIYDITGRVVYKKQLDEKHVRVQINTDDLENGVYLYAVISEQGKILAKDKLVIIN